ncbi:CLUMA_CG014692, isoform A [Clunio marinus]|uniref:CLUMA_CG014692, isoform A n=1 Tax=Clunio marinus TaxID=568069 RepID=A0A1J1IN80_9DIPT|nr:CLUMA_CG014692, isoform A [Clunio marinus]
MFSQWKTFTSDKKHKVSNRISMPKVTFNYPINDIKNQCLPDTFILLPKSTAAIAEQKSRSIVSIHSCHDHENDNKNNGLLFAFSFLKGFVAIDVRSLRIYSEIIGIKKCLIFLRVIVKLMSFADKSNRQTIHINFKNT